MNEPNIPLPWQGATLCVDFETYYDGEYSLSKITTQEYLCDPRFEVVGVSVKRDTEAPMWFSGTHEETRRFLSQFDWGNSLVIAHNAMFDGGILEWRFDLHPKMYFCTMMAARPLYAPYIKGGRTSLAKVAEYLGIGAKGTEVVKALGKRRRDFSANDMAAYARYCRNDVALSYLLYRAMSPRLPWDEHLRIDATIKKFTCPQLALDIEVLRERLEEVKHEKQQLLQDAALADRSALMSNDKFAQLLLDHGVAPPRKISPTTGKETWAFAKNDLEFQALQEHPDPKVQALVAARLGVKSTQEETRLQRFIAVAETGRLFGVPLLYYGAHTARLSGWDRLNAQNLPRGSALRRAIIAPPGHKIISGDLSQIEARVCATLAEQWDLVQQFRDNLDPYSIFATKAYGYKVTKSEETATERFVGKTCILGLQFGVGASKLYYTLKARGVDVTEEQCQGFVDTYRTAYSKIKRLWWRADRWLEAIASGATVEIFNGCYTTKDAIVLPNEMQLVYPRLRKNANGEWVYDSKGKVVYLYGAKLIENIVQALAQIVVTRAELYLYERGFRAALQVHDELVYVVSEEVAEKFVTVLERVMRRPVPWMPKLPVDCEVGMADNYAEAK